MTSKALGRFVVSGLVGMFLWSIPASARILLKPTAENAVPLRIKSLAADATIDGSFAAATLDFTFVNETRQRTQADFIYELPPGAVATYFAYWCGDEEVVARIVERERAWAIYEHITSRMRDPALVEMIGKNTFRARIFPVLPNADLRVRVRIVQALPSDPEGVAYELPLREDSEEAATLERLDAKVLVKASESIREVTNNLGLPVTREGDDYRLALSGTNYRPQKDLRVGIVRKERMLHVSLYAAPSGGPDGFFALALAPDHSLSKPRVSIRGVSAYEVAPSTLPDVKAHETVAVYGRYRGSGRATVTVSGQSPIGWLSYSERVAFGSEREPNNIATKLWAAHRIEQLSVSDANRASVIALSTRFGLPSKFTSWLAVPKAEMERYRRDQDYAEIRRMRHQLATLIAEGRDRSQPAREMRARLDALCRQYDRDPQSLLRESLRYRMRELAHKLVGEKAREEPRVAEVARLRRELERVARVTGASAAEYIDEAEHARTISSIEALQWQLLSELGQGKPDAEALKQLEERFAALRRELGRWEYGSEYGEWLAVQVELAKLGPRIDAAAAQGRPTELAELTQRQERLLKRERMLRPGEPLIAVEAPEDAQHVVALLPSGEIKRLTFNAQRRRWEARFDVPAHAAEGQYVITIIIVLKDGTRQVLTMRYRVDLTPPAGAGEARMVAAPQPTLRLDVEASEDTARVAALLPWNERVELTPSSEAARYFALVPVPAAHRGAAPAVTFVLTDKAHNRTVLIVDLAQE